MRASSGSSNRGGVEDAVLEQIALVAVSRCDPDDAAHDELHLRRVVANARQIVTAMESSGESIDAFTVEAACWMHDLVQMTKGQGAPGESARRSAEAAVAVLSDLNVDPVRIALIGGAIKAHSYSGGLRPPSVEAAIVQDADRLDALGAIGIARFWATMVRMGGRMYHPSDPSAGARELDDRSWALDHVERKLLKLVDLMNTPAGRAEAERRTEFLRQYRRELLREIGAEE